MYTTKISLYTLFYYGLQLQVIWQQQVQSQQWQCDLLLQKLYEPLPVRSAVAIYSKTKHTTDLPAYSHHNHRVQLLRTYNNNNVESLTSIVTKQVSAPVQQCDPPLLIMLYLHSCQHNDGDDFMHCYLFTDCFFCCMLHQFRFQTCVISLNYQVNLATVY
ncbi:hypothetical protein BDF19DRAFT_110554 [Syncephalis fuscata]|nr:hypothetical protein BDF19DRAFT_110554 [Syncephalis fuscata]